MFNYFSSMHGDQTLKKLTLNGVDEKKNILLCSFEVAHVLMEERVPFLKSERLCKRVLKIGANRLHA